MPNRFQQGTETGRRFHSGTANDTCERTKVQGLPQSGKPCWGVRSRGPHIGALGASLWLRRCRRAQVS
eukprot:561661-Prymnesium_polylepis.1